MQLAARLKTRARALTAMRLALMDEPLRRVLGLAATVGAAEISLSQLRAGAAALEPPVAVPVLFDALDRACGCACSRNGTKATPSGIRSFARPSMTAFRGIAGMSSVPLWPLHGAGTHADRWLTRNLTCADSAGAGPDRRSQPRPL